MGGFSARQLQAKSLRGLHSGFESGDQLAFTAPAGSGITGNYNASTGVLTLTGSASSATYQTALRDVTFNNESSSVSSKTVSFTVTDPRVQSTAATKTIAMYPPFLTGSAGGLGSRTVTIDPAAQASELIT
jgi:hypothetical protein